LHRFRPSLSRFAALVSLATRPVGLTHAQIAQFANRKLPATIVLANGSAKSVLTDKTAKSEHAIAAVFTSIAKAINAK
jgi:hypothetical protein